MEGRKFRQIFSAGPLATNWRFLLCLNKIPNKGRAGSYTRALTPSAGKRRHVSLYNNNVTWEGSPQPCRARTMHRRAVPEKGSPVGRVPAAMGLSDAGGRERPPVLFAGESTGLGGLLSIDRSEAAALLSTTPRSTPKSSASDSAPLSRRDRFPPRGREKPSPAPGQEVRRWAARPARSRWKSRLSRASLDSGIPT